MILKRTANAGILLALDGVSILFDGVSREGTAYPATSVEMQDQLIQCKPDALCITHMHPDHYDKNFVIRYKREVGGRIVCPFCDDTYEAIDEAVEIGSVKVTPIKSRHIGKVGIDVPHASFIVEGTSCVWFMGDAAVLQWKNHKDLPKPDVLIVPFAYANTATSWEITKDLGADTVVIVHMPDREADPFLLWNAVTTITSYSQKPNVYIPEIGQTLTIFSVDKQK